MCTLFINSAINTVYTVHKTLVEMFSVLSYRREGTVAKVTAGSSVLKCSGACVYLSSRVTAAEVKNRQ